MNAEIYNFLFESPEREECAAPLSAATPESTLSRVLESLDVSFCGGFSFKGLVFGSAEKGASSPPINATPACGYVFKKGDAVWRCRTCGLDDTCVLCVRCFKATHNSEDPNYDPSMHDTSFHLSSGAGGCCDCGDAEAFKVPLNCKYHSGSQSNLAITNDEENAEPIPDAVHSSMQSTISTVLDFIIDTLLRSPEKLDAADPPHFDVIYTPVGVPFNVVLWNDEVHTFQEVIDVLVDSLDDCDEEQAKKIAETIDSRGRVAIEELHIGYLPGASPGISSIGLQTTMRSKHETLREELAGLLVKWLKDLPTRVVSRFNSLVRGIICEALMAPHFARPTFELTQEFKDEFTNRCQGFSLEVRVDYLMAVDVRLWKELRHTLRELYISTLILAGDDTKKALAVRFASNYAAICERLLIVDREPEHNIMYFSVQLLTVPTIASHLFENSNLFGTICAIARAALLTDAIPSSSPLGPEKKKLKALIKTLLSPTPNLQEVVTPMPCHASVLSDRRMWHIFNDIRYLLNAPPVSNKLAREQTKWLQQLFRVLFVAQGMNPHRRRVRTHIEYESEAWAVAFNLSLQLTSVLEVVGEAYKSTVARGGSSQDSISELQFAIAALGDLMNMVFSRIDIENSKRQFTVTSLVRMCDSLNDTGQVLLADYIVRLIPCSFHHPIHWFIASILTQIPALLRAASSSGFPVDVKRWWHSVFRIVDPRLFTTTLPASNTEQDEGEGRRWFIMLTEFFDIPIQKQVFLSQIRANIWVRNGFAMRQQVAFFKEYELRERAHDKEVFLIQTAVCVMGARWVLMEILERFELLGWISGNVSGVMQSTGFDENQINLLVEDMLSLIITLVTERSVAGNASLEEQARLDIIHVLASGPLAFSKIANRISDDVAKDNVLFENTVKQVANLKMTPSGGVYELKDDDSIWDDIDLWYYHLGSGKRSSIEETLRARQAAKKQVENPSQQVKLPKLRSISDTGYEALDTLVTTDEYCAIIAGCLYNHLRMDSYKCKNAMVLDGTIWLILIALSCPENKSQTFIQNAAVIMWKFQENETKTLLHLILQLYTTCKSDMAVTENVERLPVIQHIIRSMLDSTVESAKAILRDAMPELVNQDKGQVQHGKERGRESPMEAEFSDEESKRKQAAKERQAALMAQMAAQQAQFMAAFSNEFMEEEDDDEFKSANEDMTDDDMSPVKIETRNRSFPVGEPCIVCQEATSTSCEKLFGILGFSYSEYLRRYLDTANGDEIKAVSNLPKNGLQPKDADSLEYQNKYLTGDPLQHNRRANLISHKGATFSSCGHVIHYRCFHNSVVKQDHERSDRRELITIPMFYDFQCPLCKTVGNALLPVIWSDKEELVAEDVGDLFEDSEHHGRRLMEDLESWIGPNLTESSLWTTLSKSNTESGDEEKRLKEIKEKARDAILATSPPQFPGVFFYDEQQERRAKDDFHSMHLYHFMDNINRGHVFPSEGLDYYPNCRELWEMMLSTMFNSINAVEVGLRCVGTPKTNEFGNIDVLNALSSSQITQLRSVFESCKLNLAEFMSYEFPSTEMLDDAVAEFDGPYEPGLPNLIHDIGFADLVRRETLSVLRNFSSAVFLKDPLDLLIRVSHTVNLFQTSDKQDQIRQITYWARLIYTIALVQTIVAASVKLVAVDSPLVSTSSTILDALSKAEGELESHADLHPSASGIEVTAISQFLQWLFSSKLSIPPEMSDSILKKLDSRLFVALVRQVLAGYLRQFAIFLYINYGISPSPNTRTGVTTMSEFDALSTFLLLPSIPDILNIIATQEQSRISRLIQSNMDELLKPLSLLEPREDISGIEVTLPDQVKNLASRKIPVLSPLPFNLIRLPHRLDTLLEYVLQTKCKACGNVPTEPAICLVCGELCCARSYCCHRTADNLGECNIHREKCTYNIGVFLLVKKSTVLLLYGNEKGTLIPAPYLDAHGESDTGLRRGKPLYLNMEKYQELRKIVLTNRIPSMIAARTENLMLDFVGWSLY